MISNGARAEHSSAFEITRMISDQIVVHSVQLPLYIIHVTYAFIHLSTVLFSVSLTSKQSSYRGCSRHSNCYYNSSDRRRHLLLEKKKQTRCTNSGCAHCHHHNNYDHYSATPYWIPSRDYTAVPTPWYTPYSSPTP